MSDENLLGKVSCFDSCQHNHNCFGCYLTEDPTFDEAVREIKKRFLPVEVHFWPKNNVGDRFVVVDGKKYVLDNGELQELK
jgi:hypothetical protein